MKYEKILSFFLKKSKLYRKRSRKSFGMMTSNQFGKKSGGFFSPTTESIYFFKNTDYIFKKSEILSQN